MTQDEKETFNLRAKDFELNVPYTPPVNPEEIDLKKFRNINGVKAKDDTQFVSKEQAEYFAREIKHCKEDIIYFAEKYFYIVTWQGKVVIKLFDRQKEILNSFVKNKFSVVCSGRQQGKTQTSDTQVLTKNNLNRLQIMSLKDIWDQNK